jgi:hypothetical protein
MHVGSVGDGDVFGSMVFWWTYSDSSYNRNNLVYRSACPSGTLAFSVDIPRVYSAGYSHCDLGMAWKNVASRHETRQLRPPQNALTFLWYRIP